MSRIVLLALVVYAIARDALDTPFTACYSNYCSDAAHMQLSPESFADVVLHDAAQDIKLGHSYGQYDQCIARYYNIN